MKKYELVQKLHENFDDVDISSSPEDKTSVIKMSKTGSQPILIRVEDQGLSGISAFFESDVRKPDRLLHCYHWEKVYDWIWWKLCNMELTQRHAPQKAFLKEKRYTFEWNHVCDIFGIDDDSLMIAVELVKFGFIRSLRYNDGKVLLKTEPSAMFHDTAENILYKLQKTDEGKLAENPEYAIIVVESDDRIGESNIYNENGKSKMIYSFPYYRVCGYLEYLAGKNMLSDFLKQREEALIRYKRPTGAYSFTWCPPNGLRLLPENLFQMARQIVGNGLIQVGSDLTETNCVQIRSFTWVSNLKNGGKEDIEVTPSLMAEKIEDQRKEERGILNGYIEINVAAPLCSRDLKEPYACIYQYAAYIQYLQDTGQSNTIDADRKWNRENMKTMEQKLREKNAFSFSMPTDQFMDVSDEMFETAELLQERNHVSLFTQPVDGQYVIRHTNFDSGFYEDLSALKETILEDRARRDRTCFCNAEYGRRLDGYDPYEYKQLGKIILLAGYIDYLRRSGQYTSYMERRLKERKLANGESENWKYEDQTLKDVLAAADNEKNRSLYCILEGERGSGRREITRRIAELLVKRGKIDSADPESFTFESIASYLGYKQEHTARHVSVEDSFMFYEDFQERTLYLLFDLKEFLFHCKGMVDGDDSKEAHLIKLLGRYKPNTYIIIVGEKNYVDQFLNLSPSIRFLFGDHVVRSQNLRPDQMFKAYVNALSDNLQRKVSEDKKFENDFLNYLALNRALLPLENMELAEYMADYANNRESLELPPSVYHDQTAEEMLQNVVGLKNIKKKLLEFEKYAIYRKRAESQGIKLPNSSMHMVFTGNPGTGKTTIARIMANMLFSIGVLKTNKLTEVERKDLVGEYIGQTAIKTSGVIDRAMDGVLFIDEAYTLVPSSERDFAHEALATLIKAMEDYKDRLIIIFAGYEKEMHTFVNSNPGLFSRIGYTFHFDDYSTDELVQMFDTKIHEAGLTYNEKDQEQIKIRVKELCEYFKNKDNFGNGRFIDQVVQQTIVTRSQRKYTDKSMKTLLAKDIPSTQEMVSTDVVAPIDFEEQLKSFVGMDDVKNLVWQFAKYAQLRQAMKQSGETLPEGNMHMLFVGNPGTGKTAMARVMAEILYSIGLTNTNRLFEVSANELMGQYIGQTANNTTEIIERAIGGVLFIDEAYDLADAGNKEAVSTLIKAMEDYKDSLIVIFAGYEEQMKHLLEVNSGIASRIGFTLKFDDYSADQLVEIFNMKMKAAGIEYEDHRVLKKVHVLCDHFRAEKNFGNGRFVDNIIQRTFIKYASRNVQDKSKTIILSAEDIPDIDDISKTAGFFEPDSNKIQLGFHV